MLQYFKYLFISNRDIIYLVLSLFLWKFIDWEHVSAGTTKLSIFLQTNLDKSRKKKPRKNGRELKGEGWMDSEMKGSTLNQRQGKSSFVVELVSKHAENKFIDFCQFRSHRWLHYRYIVVGKTDEKENEGNSLRCTCRCDYWWCL